MADWNDLKKAFERDLNKQAEQFVMNEQNLLESVAAYLAKEKGTSALQGYDTNEIVDFLKKPISEIKASVGGQWETLDDKQLEVLVYSLIKKVKKSVSFLDFSRK